MMRKPIDELPTHYLQWQEKPKRIWRVRLLNPHGYTKPDGKRYFTVLLDPRSHPGLHLLSNIAEDRLRPIVPSPAIARMLFDRYGLHVRKERGETKYWLYH